MGFNIIIIDFFMVNEDFGVVMLRRFMFDYLNIVIMFIVNVSNCV